MHTHVGDPAGTALLVESARLYEMTKLIGIAPVDNARVLGEAFPGYFDFAVSLDYRRKDDARQFEITREVSLKPERSREFIIRYAGRILYGSDLVVRAGWQVQLYSSRYWIHRVLWESDTVCDLPIEDPDHPGSPQIAGIDLPVDVLEKMYYQNAVRLLNVQLAG